MLKAFEITPAYQRDVVALGRSPGAGGGVAPALHASGSGVVYARAGAAKLAPQGCAKQNQEEESGRQLCKSTSANDMTEPRRGHASNQKREATASDPGWAESCAEKVPPLLPERISRPDLHRMGAQL